MFSGTMAVIVEKFFIKLTYLSNCDKNNSYYPNNPIIQLIFKLVSTKITMPIINIGINWYYI